MNPTASSLLSRISPSNPSTMRYSIPTTILSPRSYASTTCSALSKHSPTASQPSSPISSLAVSLSPRSLIATQSSRKLKRKARSKRTEARSMETNIFQYDSKIPTFRPHMATNMGFTFRTQSAQRTRMGVLNTLMNG